MKSLTLLLIEIATKGRITMSCKKWTVVHALCAEVPLTKATVKAIQIPTPETTCPM